jgi:hypothetical protein
MNVVHVINIVTIVDCLVMVLFKKGFITHKYQLFTIGLN